MNNFELIELIDKLTKHVESADNTCELISRLPYHQKQIIRAVQTELARLKKENYLYDNVVVK